MWHLGQVGHFEHYPPALSAPKFDGANTKSWNGFAIHTMDCMMGYRCEFDEVGSNRGTMTHAARVNAVWELSTHCSTYLLPTQLKGFEAVGQFQVCSEFVPVS